MTGHLGSFPAILFAVLLILAWVGQGIAHWLSVGGNFIATMEVSSYQLEINTTTTIITFLMVFIIQNTQNRDGAAAQVKLDALLEFVAALADDREMVLPVAVAQLIGLEDAPERVIAAERDEVRHAGSHPTSS